MPVAISWDKGGDALIEKLDGDKIELSSSIPFAPGSRPEGTLEAPADRIWIKVHGSRKQPDGRFHVAGRLLNATRAQIDRLRSALVSPTS